MRRAFALIAVTALSGCMVGPNYHAPAPDVPPAFAEAPPGGGTGAATADLAHWWHGFGDAELDRLVTTALAQNLDVQAAVARLRQARAGTAAARAELLPDVEGMGNVTRTRFSQNAGFSSLASLFGGGSSQGGSGGSSSGGGIALPGGAITTYSVGFDATWEIDLFGGRRRAVQGAVARFEGAEWQVRDTAVSLAAEVAQDYLTLRMIQARQVVLEAEIARQQRNIALLEHRAQAGLVPAGDAIRQRAQLATAIAQRDPLIAEAQIRIHALAFLTGQPPETLLAELNVPRALPVLPPDIPPGLPSDLLRRRPDIRAAERNLAAATADIGVAVADLYPKFRLTDLTQLISTALGNLFSGDSLQVTASANAMFPILDFGRRRSQVHVREAEADQAYLQYRRTVLAALRDVEDALVRIRTERGRNASLRAGIADAERAVGVADARYRSGLADLSAVLEVQQGLLTQRDALVQSDGALSADMAALYKALGGGWDEATIRAADRPAGRP